AREQAGVGREGQRNGRVGPFEDDAPGGQLVEDGREAGRSAKSTHPIGARRVERHEQQIAARGSRTTPPPPATGKATQKQEGSEGRSRPQQVLHDSPLNPSDRSSPCCRPI